MIRQLIFVITSLLFEKRNATIHCARTVMNFVMLAQFVFHDESILSYMIHALYKLNNLKNVFFKYRFQNTIDDVENENEKLFNIFKLHVMIHYVIFIRFYDNVQSFDTSYDESIHKTLLKNFFSRTNKNENWKTQILQHNIRRHNIVAMNDIFIWLKIKQIFVSKNRWKIDSIIANRNSIQLSIRLIANNKKTLIELKFSQKRWCKTEKIVENEKFKRSKFINALIVFIKEKRKKKVKRLRNEFELNEFEKNANTRERNSSWTKNYFVEIHMFLKCWKKKEKNVNNLNVLKSKRIRCAYRWRKIKHWRKDSVWIQKHESNKNYANDDWITNNDRCVEIFQLVVSMIDHEHLSIFERSRIYQKTLIDVKRWVMKKTINSIHEMYEMKNFSST